MLYVTVKEKKPREKCGTDTDVVCHYDIKKIKHEGQTFILYATVMKNRDTWERHQVLYATVMEIRDTWEIHWCATVKKNTEVAETCTDAVCYCEEKQKCRRDTAGVCYCEEKKSETSMTASILKQDPNT